MVRKDWRFEWEIPANGEKTSPSSGMRPRKFAPVRKLKKVILYLAEPLQLGKGKFEFSDAFTDASRTAANRTIMERGDDIFVSECVLKS